MGDEGGIRKKFQPQVPTIEMYSPPQYVRSKVKICSPKQTYVQSHAIQSHQSILGEASPRTPNAKVDYKSALTCLITCFLDISPKSQPIRGKYCQRHYGRSVWRRRWRWKLAAKSVDATQTKEISSTQIWSPWDVLTAIHSHIQNKLPYHSKT